jgi:hypothetical protein
MPRRDSLFIKRIKEAAGKKIGIHFRNTPFFGPTHRGVRDAFRYLEKNHGIQREKNTWII